MPNSNRCPVCDHPFEAGLEASVCPECGTPRDPQTIRQPETEFHETRSIDEPNSPAVLHASRSVAHWTGRTIGEYEVQECIGAGGMGEVYKARQVKLNRTVAIKILRPETCKSSDAVARFYREARAAARLRHPNVLVAFDARIEGDLHYLLMDYVEGRSFRELVKQEGALEWKQATEYLLQAACGVSHAHQEGILHRDIKPSNLLVDRQNVVRVLDLGLAKLQDQGPEAGGETSYRTRTGMILGTPAYMAPEQMFEPARVDQRADVYSLGCTLYCLLTASDPYEKLARLDQLLAHKSEPLDLLGVIPDLPPALAAVFGRSVAKSPDDRYCTVAEMIHDLELVLETPGAADSIARQDRIGGVDSDVVHLIDQLAACDLLSKEETNRFLLEFSPDRRPQNASQLLEQLALAGKCTTYQTVVLKHSDAESLMLGDWVLHDKLSSTQGTALYEARHRKSRAKAHIRVLAVADSPAQFFQQFDKHVGPWTRLKHPNVRELLDVGHKGNALFIVMEHMAIDLRRYVRQSGTLELPQAVDLTLAAVQGLQAAFAKKVPHGAFRPSALWLSGDDAKVTEPGVARFYLDYAGSEETDMVRLADEFVAPELGRALQPVNERSEIFSLGATMFYMLTGNPVYYRDRSLDDEDEEDEEESENLANPTRLVPDLGDCLSQISGRKKPKSVQRIRNMAAPLQKVFERMVAWNPERRYQTFKEVFDGLRRVKRKLAGKAR